MPPRLDLETLGRRILVYVHSQYVQNQTVLISPNNVSELLGVAEDIARLALRRLSDQGHLSEVTREVSVLRTEINDSQPMGLMSPYVPGASRQIFTGTYNLTLYGISFVERLSSEDYEILVGSIGSSQQSRTVEWEPLPVERPDAELGEAVEKLTDLKGLVQQDNGYAVAAGLERDDVVSRLSAAIEYLDHCSVVSYSAVQVFILWPLERLLARFSPKTAVGIAAELAWETLKGWLKHRGIKGLDDLFS